MAFKVDGFKTLASATVRKPESEYFDFMSSY